MTFPRPLFVSAVLLFFSASAVAGIFYKEGETTLHFAFEGSPNGDRPIIRPPANYYAEDGFGFVNSPTLVGTSTGVTAPKYFRFDVNIPAGTYDVSVRIGGTKEDSITSIKAEGQATAVKDVTVAPKQNEVRSFTVTVKRGATGDTSIEGDGCLTLEFEGTNPSLMKLDIKPAAKPASP
jgi:hypothetical protein